MLILYFENSTVGNGIIMSWWVRWGQYFACDQRVRSGQKFDGLGQKNGPVEISGLVKSRKCVCVYGMIVL